MKTTYRTNFLFILSLVIIALVLTNCKTKTQKHDGYTISGTIKGLENGWVKLIESGGPDSKIKIIDSTEIINGTFNFKGTVESPDIINLIIENKNDRFFLENSNINIDVDWSTVKPEDRQFTSVVSGSKTNDEYERLEAESQSIFKNPKYAPLETISEAYAKAKKSNDPKLLEEAMALQEKLSSLAEERNSEYTKMKYDYARNNPNSAVAVQFLGFQYSEGRMNKEQLKEFYNLFQGDAKKTAFYQNYITKVYKDVFENLGVGNTAPGFTLNTVDGKPLSLVDVKGKYRLIDFWASWCIPCRASFPHLKELRKKYGNDNFEIVGVGTADVEGKWRNAIDEDQISWPQIFDHSDVSAQGRASYGEVAKLYGVPFLPTTFLIDENQTILLRNASKEELDAKLKELLGY